MLTDREAAFNGCFEKIPKLLERIKSALEARGTESPVIEKIEGDYKIFMHELRRLHQSGLGVPDDVFAKLPSNNRWVDCLKMVARDVAQQKKPKNSSA